MEVQGLKKCPEYLKHAYKKAVEFHCEDCGKVFLVGSVLLILGQ